LTEYSPGPFHRMSPTGLPGLLVVLVVCVVTASLFPLPAVIIGVSVVLGAGVLAAIVLHARVNRTHPKRKAMDLSGPEDPNRDRPAEDPVSAPALDAARFWRPGRLRAKKDRIPYRRPALDAGELECSTRRLDRKDPPDARIQGAGRPSGRGSPGGPGGRYTAILFLGPRRRRV
jgi:hypothetical protein